MPEETLWQRSHIDCSGAVLLLEQCHVLKPLGSYLRFKVLWTIIDHPTSVCLESLGQGESGVIASTLWHDDDGGGHTPPRLCPVRLTNWRDFIISTRFNPVEIRIIASSRTRIAYLICRGGNVWTSGFSIRSLSILRGYSLRTRRSRKARARLPMRP